MKVTGTKFEGYYDIHNITVKDNVKIHLRVIVEDNTWAYIRPQIARIRNFVNEEIHDEITP